LPNSTCQVELLYLAFLTAMVVSFLYLEANIHISFALPQSLGTVRAWYLCIRCLTIHCRSGSGALRKRAFLQGAGEAKVVLEQVLQRGPGRVLL
jgi:hypothetical protein